MNFSLEDDRDTQPWDDDRLTARCIWCGALFPIEDEHDERDYCSDLCAVAAETSARDPRRV